MVGQAEFGEEPTALRQDIVKLVTVVTVLLVVVPVVLSLRPWPSSHSMVTLVSISMTSVWLTDTTSK